MVRRRRWLPPLIVAAVVLVVGAFAGGVAVMSIGSKHPRAWDPRVADLATFVEDARGLEFRHPVHVDFLDADEYSEATRASEDDLLDEDREELERFAAELRALGLAEGELDLFAAFNEVIDAGTLAFYDVERQRIRVRGTELTPNLRVTLVHELTHALQDQHFDLTPLFEGEDAAASNAMRALVEGDAMRVEDRYVERGLTDDERASHDQQLADETTEALDRLDDVPDVLPALFGVPYALGPGLVLALEATGGDARVDEAFEDPPTTGEHLFDPLTYLAGEGSVEVDLDLREDPLDEGSFGSTMWYLVLAERLDPEDALRAVDGWGGDAYAVLDRDGRTCVRAVFAGDDDGEEQEMAVALRAWAATMPADADATVIDVDGRPGLDTCDPGTDVATGTTGRSGDALALPATRAYVLADALTVFDEDGARCFAEAVLDRFELDDLLAEEGPGEDDVQAAALGAVATCDL